MIIDFNILLIFIAILVVCLIGFKKYIWFISIGYGLSISIVGIMLLILFFDELDILKITSSIVLICYGIRLSGFLAIREFKNNTYSKKMKNEIKDGSNMTILLKIFLWITCAILYLFMTSPIIFRFINNSNENISLIIGIIISIIGIIIESVSDFQKNKSKKKNPDKFCSSGLFKIVRCPNYFGELIIWTGVFITGINCLTIPQFLISIIGYVGIIYVMFSGARRLEIRQDKTYGKDPNYMKYIKKTPILIPLIPLYSVKKYKWLVA